MPRKFELDTLIAKDIKSVAADSFVDNIKMILVERIKPCKENFFSLTEIEILADDIERQGLKHNLVVCEDKDNLGTFWIKSGHRRFAAINLLLEKNRLTTKTVPCLVDGVKSKSENMLDLIMLNATARIMNDAEIMEQYKVLERTYKELELEGKKFSGRLRERIADALKVSPAQAGKIENINHNAIPEIKAAIEKNNMSISTANEVAKLEPKKQKELIENKPIEKITPKEVKAIKENSTPKEKPQLQEFEPFKDEFIVTLNQQEVTAIKNFVEKDAKENDYLALKKILKRLGEM
ncbi:MAG: ParB/Srx family N-terminal domain-containing protein [Oscillospiraceae bacterium]